VRRICRLACGTDFGAVWMNAQFGQDWTSSPAAKAASGQSPQTVTREINPEISVRWVAICALRNAPATAPASMLS
jgi:hypothetical protein